MPDRKPAPVKKEPDELDRIAATKVVSVVTWPLLDGTDQWGIRVDKDNSMSPFEARGVLDSGSDYLKDIALEWIDPEDDGDEGG